MGHRLRSHKGGAASGSRAECATFCEGVGKRLAAIRGGRSQREFAASIGCHPNTVGQYERGERAPILSIVNRVCEVYRLEHRWLLTGFGPRRASAGGAAGLSEGQRYPRPDEPGSLPAALASCSNHVSDQEGAWVPGIGTATALATIPVPLLGAPPSSDMARNDREGSTGEGSTRNTPLSGATGEGSTRNTPLSGATGEGERESPVERWFFPRGSLERELGAPPRSPYLLRMEGDAMEPTIRDGELMLLDELRPNDDRQGVFLVRIDRQAVVRRLQALPGRIVQVSADNTRYPSFSIADRSERAAEGFLILSRILRTLHRP